MYQVGELVVYGMHGVCRVVSEEERLVDKKRLNYLALEPLSNGNSRFLVPTQNAAAMAKLQPILSKEELEAMITSENVKTGEWIREENQRKQTYRELIGSGDRKILLTAGHHANETITSEVLWRFLFTYCEALRAERTVCGADALSLYHEAMVYLVPLVNPDGADLAAGAIAPGSAEYCAAAQIAAGFPEFASVSAASCTSAVVVSFPLTG